MHIQKYYFFSVCVWGKFYLILLKHYHTMRFIMADNILEIFMDHQLRMTMKWKYLHTITGSNISHHFQMLQIMTHTRINLSIKMYQEFFSLSLNTVSHKFTMTKRFSNPLSLSRLLVFGVRIKISLWSLQWWRFHSFLNASSCTYGKEYLPLLF